MGFEIALMVVGILLLVKSLMLLIFPSFSKKLVENIFKSHKTVIKVGIWELILGIILIFIGMNI